MTPQERWRQVDEIYHAAVQRPPEERAAFLREACRNDDELRREVESLLALETAAEAFLNAPALEEAARIVAREETRSLCGRTFGAYRLLSEIGAGGMGRVYLAEDTRLGRQVAVKILPPELSSEARRKHRFAQEARAASALNHPNIVTVHDIGNADGVDYIVMEYIQGETLARRIPQGGLPFEETRRYALQIADALAQAHSAGIVHRDLKPGNIMVTGAASGRPGLVKVLDFGLAKVSAAFPQAGPKAGLSADAVIVGTVAYMSPEQAKGQPVDSRTDVFSFGAVLYEMLTGERAFEGDSNASTLAAVLTKTPKLLHGAKTPIPGGLERILARCLAKDREQRWQKMEDVKRALEGVAARPPRARRWRLWAAAALGLLLAAGLWYMQPGSGRPAGNQPLVLSNYPGQELYPSLSPDGRKLAFSWQKEGETDIYVRPVEGRPEAIRLTQHRAPESYPRWSPDGPWIAYTQGAKRDFTLMVIPVSGGFPRELGHFGFRCIDWTPDAKWIAATAMPGPDDISRLVRVSPETGEIRPIPYQAGDSRSTLDVYPAVSRDGKRIAFSRTNATSNTGDVFVMALEGGVPRRLTHRNRYISGLAWTPDGREIVFQSAVGDYRGLFRIAVDATEGAEPARVSGAEAGQYPVFAGQDWNGPPRLVYTRAGRDPDVVRVDLAAGAAAVQAARRVAGSRDRELSPAVSPDGRQVAFASSRSGKLELWVTGSEGGPALQLTRTADPWIDSFAWSPDRSKIAFVGQNLFTVRSGGGPLRPITPAQARGFRPSFSPDGRWMYFRSGRVPPDGFFRVPAEGGPHAPETWQRVTSAPGVADGNPSPDGRLFLYTCKDRPGLFAVPAEGGAERVVLQRSGTIWFSVSRERVYYIEITNQPLLSTVPKPLRRIHLETGRDELVAPIAAPMRPYADRLFSVSPDGAFVVFTEVKQVADLMLIDNFR